MLHTYSYGVLLGPTAIILVVTLFTCWHFTRNGIAAITAALIKASIFLVYFHFYFDGTFTFLDDISYMHEAEFYYAHGITIFNLLNNWFLILAVSGKHFVYQIYNTYAFYLFGVGYFAPVALNSALMCLTAALGTKIAEYEFGFVGEQRKIFFLFLLLYPSTLAWSSLVSSKDILVLLAHVLMLYGISLILRRRSVVGLIVLVGTALVTFFLRFYVPLLFAAAFAGAVLVGAKGKRRLQLLATALILVGATVSVIGSAMLHAALITFIAHFTDPFYGALAFILSPIPLHTEPNYRFLEIPSIIHWVLAPFFVFGFFPILRRRTLFSRFFIIYIMIFIGLYAAFAELQGPRHRIQLDFAWAVFEFAGIMEFVRDATRRRFSERKLAVARP